jgi:hypothetical protein
LALAINSSKRVSYCKHGSIGVGFGTGIGIGVGQQGDPGMQGLVTNTEKEDFT